MRFAVESAVVVATLVPLLTSTPGAWSANALAQSAAPRGSAPAAPSPRREPAVPFAVGETLTYDVSWSSIFMAGTAVATVKDKSQSSGSAAYTIVAEGRPIPIVARLYALYYKMDTVLDSVTLLPHRGSLYAEEGKDRRTSTTTFDRAARRVHFEEQTATTTKLDYAVPAAIQDGLSTLYVIRSRTFKAGDRIAVPVADSGTLYNVDITVGAPELVKVPFGQTTAWPLRGVIKDTDGMPVWNNIVVWISNDARRLPVKMQADLAIGTFVLALREAR
jgi:uncharacterized protein DUF3108